MYVDVHADVVEIKSTRETLAQLPLDDRHRKLLPLETFSVMSGVKGGIAGGLAMIVPAALYGLIRYHSVWYAANLLAAGGFVSWAGESNAFLAQFHLRGLLAALAIHGLDFGVDWTALRRDAADVSQEADSDCRLYRTVFVDGHSPFGAWDYQPDSGSADRLVVVYCVADCVRPGCRICGQSPCEGADAAVSIAAIHGSGRNSHPGRRTRIRLHEIDVSAADVVLRFGSGGEQRLRWLAAAAFLDGLGLGLRCRGLTKCWTFRTLYKANCAACHGENGRDGAAISLANPVYLAIAGEENLRQYCSERSFRQVDASLRQECGGHVDGSADRGAGAWDDAAVEQAGSSRGVEPSAIQVHADG